MSKAFLAMILFGGAFISLLAAHAVDGLYEYGALGIFVVCLIVAIKVLWNDRKELVKDLKKERDICRGERIEAKEEREHLHLQLLEKTEQFADALAQATSFDEARKESRRVADDIKRRRGESTRVK